MRAPSEGLIDVRPLRNPLSTSTGMWVPTASTTTSTRIPVLVDSGFRSGADVYKALALGARMVGIGRPYIYGLASFGQEGVEKVLDIMRSELQLIMKQCGTPTMAQISRAYIARS